MILILANLGSAAEKETTAPAQEVSKALTLWYRQPATEWLQALPIGNGRLGAMVFGGIEQEHLQLNEDTLWSGGPHRYDNPDAYQHLPPWNHGMIAAGPDNNGFSAVAFGASGDYTFDLRRWPKEIAGETTVTSELRTPIPVGSAGRDGKYKRTRGKALAIRAARIRIWHGDKTYADEKQAVNPDSDGAVFTIRSLPAGPAMVQTWFFDAAGKELGGVYYNYVHRVEATAR